MLIMTTQLALADKSVVSIDKLLNINIPIGLLTYDCKSMLVGVIKASTPKYSHDEHHTIVVTLDNGEELECSLDHELVTATSKIIPARDMKIGQRLMGWSDKCGGTRDRCLARSVAKMRGVRHTNPIQMYEIPLSSGDSVGLACGIFVRSK